MKKFSQQTIKVLKKTEPHLRKLTRLTFKKRETLEYQESQILQISQTQLVYVLFTLSLAPGRCDSSPKRLCNKPRPEHLF